MTARPPRPQPRHVCVTCLHWSHGCLLTSGPKAGRAGRWFRAHVQRRPTGLPVTPKAAPPCPGWAEAWPKATDWMRGGRPRFVPHGFHLTPEEEAYWLGTPTHEAPVEADDLEAA